jgi:hypothetical protein
MMELKGHPGKHIELIKSEKDIDSILQKGGDAAKRTIYVINEFREMMSEFAKFRYQIESQNALLKSQDEAVRNKEFSEAEKAALRIWVSFEEEKKFYQFLVRKEQEEKIEMLKAFGEMEDITLLGNIMAGMAKSSERLTEVRGRLYRNYELLEKLKRAVAEERAGGDIIEEINRLESEIAENIKHLREESERIMRTEEMIRSINSKIGAVGEQKAEKTDESRIKKVLAEVGDWIKNLRKERKKVEEGVAKVEVEQQNVEKKEGGLMKLLQSRGLIKKPKT